MVNKQPDNQTIPARKAPLIRRRAFMIGVMIALVLAFAERCAISDHDDLDPGIEFVQSVL
jgi:hypothetical protein